MEFEKLLGICQHLKCGLEPLAFEFRQFFRQDIVIGFKVLLKIGRLMFNAGRGNQFKGILKVRSSAQRQYIGFGDRVQRYLWIAPVPAPDR